MGLDEKIIKAIQIIVDRAVSGLIRSDIETTITKIDSNGNLWAPIDGAEYKIKNGTNIDFRVGDKCLVHLINGDFTNKLIIAKR